MKRFHIVLLLVVFIFSCFLVSCSDEPKKWVATYTEKYKSSGIEYEMVYSITLFFDGKGNVTSVSYIESLKVDGVETIDNDKYTESERTVTQYGTYTDTEISFTTVEEGVKVTLKASYTITGNKLTLTREGKSVVFTKQ